MDFSIRGRSQSVYNPGLMKRMNTLEKQNTNSKEEDKENPDIINDLDVDISIPVGAKEEAKISNPP